MRRCTCVLAALAASFSLNGAFGQAAAGGSPQGPDADRASLAREQHQALGQNPDQHAPPPGGNPLWGVPLSALSATRDRPIFSASRRPPAPPPPPMPVAEAPPPPPPPAQPEQPHFTLVGTAIGKPQNVALIFDSASKNLVRLYVGEAASGWTLRSVDLRTMTLEKDSQTVVLALPTPGTPAPSPGMAAAPLLPPRPPPAVALAGRLNHEF